MYVHLGDFAPTQPRPVMRTDIPQGYHGTARTIEQMYALAREGTGDPRIIALARGILVDAHVPPKDKVAEARVLLAWVQRNIRYVNDPIDVEHLAHPAEVIWGTRSGDCDELSVVLAALAGSVGIPYQFRTVGTNPLDAGDQCHVYVLLFLNGGWVAADPSFQRELGWEPPMATHLGFMRPPPGVAATRRDWHV